MLLEIQSWKLNFKESLDWEEQEKQNILRNVQ